MARTDTSTAKTAKPAPSASTATPNLDRAKAQAVAIPHVKASALSVDVGPAILTSLDASNKAEAKANTMLAEVNTKRYDAAAQLTQAILKAVAADPSIDLNAAFKDEKAAQNKLNDQLMICLGLRTPETRTVKAKGEDGKMQETTSERLVYTPAAAKYFPTAADKKGTEAHQRKSTFRSNFMHLIKKQAQVAAGIIDMGVKTERDDASGSLRLTGPAVKSAFGADSVVLNEKQTVGEGDKAVKLKAKPSFTEIKRIAEQNRGRAAPGSKVDSTPRSTPAVTTEEAFGSLCNTLIAAINKISGTPTEAQAKAMRSVASAITAKLG